MTEEARAVEPTKLQVLTEHNCDKIKLQNNGSFVICPEQENSLVS